ncbi:MAG: Ig-like domain-containing protein [Bacteroidales bacterium]|jgi:hypothetical protein|nr:Ig-like domain-containing protein [Bacteroidales bacterium]
MKNHVSKWSTIALTFAAVTFAGCGDEDNKDIAVQKITLNVTSFDLDPGQTKTLTATMEPSDATNKRVVWTSDNAAATVEGDGITAVVTAVATGTAKIKVASYAAPEVFAEATVTVNAMDHALAVAGTYPGTVRMPNKGTDEVKPGYQDDNANLVLTRTGVNALTLHATATLLGGMMQLSIDCSVTVSKDETTGKYVIAGTGLTNNYGYGEKEVTILEGSVIDAAGKIDLEFAVDTINSEDVFFSGQKTAN